MFQIEQKDKDVSLLTVTNSSSEINFTFVGRRLKPETESFYKSCAVRYFFGNIILELASIGTVGQFRFDEILVLNCLV